MPVARAYFPGLRHKDWKRQKTPKSQIKFAGKKVWMLPHGKDAHGLVVANCLTTNGLFGFQNWGWQPNRSECGQSRYDIYQERLPQKIKMSQITKICGHGKLPGIMDDQVMERFPPMLPVLFRFQFPCLWKGEDTLPIHRAWAGL